MATFNANATAGELYNPAMELTDPQAAAAYFERLVAHRIKYNKLTRADAESIERSNLGYYAGYYSHETRQRVERLFNCAHPVFGKATETPVDSMAAFAAGLSGTTIARK